MNDHVNPTIAGILAQFATDPRRPAVPPCSCCKGTGAGVVGGTCWWCEGAGVEPTGKDREDKSWAKFKRGFDSAMERIVREHPERDPGD